MTEESKKSKTPGPVPERVKIDEPWEDAVAKALRKPKPAKGWPKDQNAEGQPQDKPKGGG